MAATFELSGGIVKILVFIITIAHFAFGSGGGDTKGKNESPNATIYSKTENELGVAENKIKTTQKKIRELLIEKNKTSDKVRVNEITKEIQELLKDFRKEAKNANKLIHKLKYELPRKGSDKHTQYKRYDENAIKEFEDEVNKLLSEVLTDLKDKYN